MKVTYGAYESDKGNRLFIVSENKGRILQTGSGETNFKILKDITIEKSDGNQPDGTIEVFATVLFYKGFPSWSSASKWWDDYMFSLYDLEDQKFEDITELKYKNLFHLIIGKKSYRIKGDTVLLKKYTDKFHLKTSNWTIKWV